MQMLFPFEAPALIVLSSQLPKSHYCDTVCVCVLVSVYSCVCECVLQSTLQSGAPPEATVMAGCGIYSVCICVDL